MNIDLFKTLKHKHKNKEFLIIGCGPSVNDYSYEEIEQFTKHKIVICIKDAVKKFKDICDYFVANCARHKKFEFNTKTIKLYHHLDRKQKIPFEKDKDILLNNYDFVFYTYDFKSINDRIEIKRNFKDFLFDNRMERDENFGIITFALYLAEFLGAKTIYTLGWDSCNRENHEKDTYDTFFKEEIYETKDKEFYNCIDKANKATPDLYKFYKSIGISIFILQSKNCYVDKIVPRIDIKS